VRETLEIRLKPGEGVRFMLYPYDYAWVALNFGALLAHFAAYLCTFVKHFDAHGLCCAALAGRLAGCFGG
jgi:hypothetical protein